MPSNILIELDDIALIEARMTVEEVFDVLGITLAEYLESLPASSVNALRDYLELE